MFLNTKYNYLLFRFKFDCFCLFILTIPVFVIVIKSIVPDNSIIETPFWRALFTLLIVVIFS